MNFFLRKLQPRISSPNSDSNAGTLSLSPTKQKRQFWSPAKANKQSVSSSLISLKKNNSAGSLNSTLKLEEENDSSASLPFSTTTSSNGSSSSSSSSSSSKKGNKSKSLHQTTAFKKSSTSTCKTTTSNSRTTSISISVNMAGRVVASQQTMDQRPAPRTKKPSSFHMDNRIGSPSTATRPRRARSQRQLLKRSGGSLKDCLLEQQQRSNDMRKSPSRPRKSTSTPDLLNSYSLSTSNHSKTSSSTSSRSSHPKEAPRSFRRASSLGTINEPNERRRHSSKQQKQTKSLESLNDSNKPIRSRSGKGLANAEWPSTGAGAFSPAGKARRAKRYDLLQDLDLLAVDAAPRSSRTSRNGSYSENSIEITSIEFCSPSSAVLDSSTQEQQQQSRETLQKVLASPQVQEIKADMKQQQQTDTEVDNCEVMREAMKRLRSQLFKMELDKCEDLCRMRHQFEAEKEQFKTKITRQYNEAMQELQWKQLHDEQEILSLETENKQLLKEQEKVSTMIQELTEGNKKLEEATSNIVAKHNSLSAFFERITDENKKLVAEEEKLATIHRGARSLKSETGQKAIYRRYMYKCAQNVNMSEGKDSAIFEDVMGMIAVCEQEAGAEVLDDVAADKVDRPAAVPLDTHSPASNICLVAHFFNDNLSVVEEGDEDATLATKDASLVDEEIASLCDEMQNTDFINNMSSKLNTFQIASLFENKDMLMTVFKFLDVDKSGKIDQEELRVGIDLLNTRLPPDAQFQDHTVLFEALDANGDGGIDLQEFNKLFTLQQ